MKRKLFVLDVILTLLLGIYSAVAWVMLRGAGAYRFGTTLGSVLAVSRPYTTLASAVLFVIAGTVLVSHLHRRGTKKDAAVLEKIVPQKGTHGEPVHAEPKLQPAKGTSAEEDTVPMGAETLPMEPETVVMEENDALETESFFAPAGQDREPVRPTPPQEETPSGPAVLQCANCGAVLKPGQRFCSRCGTPTRGGGAT